ncbi:UPF0481 protein At3g47200-like [Mangifera indica]|uniref:UPF0481 protein At3g47200-like n=1 Tax=Mangifera indica TaxID=29780 RepID=UPI001CF9BD18|nr:UPF0481 protein At3g47200-like [Mangifera indica]
MLELVEDIESSFKTLGPPMSGDCCIYRVPHNLRIVLNEDAYTPYAVSIGPLHHGRKELEPMEKVKLRYLQEFINHTHSILHDLVCFIKNMEDRIRNCYAETILFNSNEFVKMILIDAAFIILHFAKYCCDQHDEVLLRNSCLTSSICRDMMLLENQIPFFVLTELYNLKRQEFFRTTVFPFGQDEGLPPFEELAWYFFKIFFRWHWGIVRNVTENVKHFTDMLRFSHLKPDLTPGEFIIHRGGKYKLRYNASELWEAGVNIKVTYSRLDG